MQQGFSSFEEIANTESERSPVTVWNREDISYVSERLSALGIFSLKQLKGMKILDTDQGDIVVRINNITQNQTPPDQWPKIPEILQPLHYENFVFKTSYLRPNRRGYIAIFPKYLNDINSEQCDTLYYQLAERGLLIEDFNDSNAALSPRTKTPAVIDAERVLYHTKPNWIDRTARKVFSPKQCFAARNYQWLFKTQFEGLSHESLNRYSSAIVALCELDKQQHGYRF